MDVLLALLVIQDCLEQLQKLTTFFRGRGRGNFSQIMIIPCVSQFAGICITEDFALHGVAGMGILGNNIAHISFHFSVFEAPWFFFFLSRLAHWASLIPSFNTASLRSHGVGSWRCFSSSRARAARSGPSNM
jgi:hypothetical protein